MKEKLRILLPVLLVVCLVAAGVPMLMGTAFAAGTVHVDNEEDLRSVIDEVYEGFEICFDEDITLTDGLVIDQDLTLTSEDGKTLDAGGNEITVAEGVEVTCSGDLNIEVNNYYGISVIGDFILTDEAAVQGNDAYSISVFGGFTLTESASVEVFDEKEAPVYVPPGERGEVNITGGSITGGKYGVRLSGDCAVVTVSGGEINATRSGVYHRGTNNSTEISGGKITAPSAVDVGSGGTVIISGGIIEGTTNAIYASGTTVEITGGSFSGKISTGDDGTLNITSGNVTLGDVTPGVYYSDDIGHSRAFLTALPAPVSAEVGISAEIELIGVYSAVSFSIADATPDALDANVNNDTDTVTLNPTAAGSYELVLTATAVNNQKFDLTVPVEVAGDPPPVTPAATVTAAAATLTPVANTDNLITLTVKDSSGNTDTSFTGNHNVTVSGVTASVSGVYYGLFDGTIIEAGGTLTKPLAFTDGVATPILNLPRAAEQTISFSIEGVSNPATNTLTITPVPGPPAVMMLTQNITAPAVNGGQFAQQPILRFTDSSANLCTNDNSTQVTASKYDSGDWMLTGTTTATALNGIVTFNDLGATNAVRVTNAQVKFTSNASTNIYTSAAVTLPAPSSGSSGGGGGGGTTPASSTINAAVTGDTVDIDIPVNVNTGTGVGTVNVDTSNAEDMFDGNTVINVPPISGVDAYTLQMPASILSGSEGGEGLTFATENGSISIPGNMLAGLGTQGQVGITIGQGDKSLLPEEVRAALGSRPLVQLSLTVDGNQQDWNNPGSPVTVSIPYTPTDAELADPEHIVVWYIDGDGNVQSVPNGRFDPATGKVTFATTHFSYFGVAYVEKTFRDLIGVDWAKKQIEVLASKDIIKGVSETEYAPFANITRADFLYSLIRTLGVDARADGNFEDIDPNAYYYTELAVAKKLGISTGVGNNEFNPDAGITRQDMMTLTERALRMLNKLQAQGTAADLEQFSDHKLVASYAANSVAAVVNEGLIIGGNGKINPLGNTTRAEAAVFLYRIYNKY